MAHESSTMLEPADIKSRVDILDIVRRYVSIKKHGKIYQGLCPFHVEKTPSFTVFQESQSFHCFGCGAGHDVFDFIQQIENLRFPDAFKKLAAETFIASVGMVKPKPIVRQPKPRPSNDMIALYTRIYEMGRKTLLEGLDKEAESVRVYLAGRGFSRQDLDVLEIAAYLPEHREWVAQLPNEELIKKSGLVSYGKGYNYQIVMPHRDKDGIIIGLTFRILKEGKDQDGRVLSKYKHTPDLDKEYLFNLHDATPHIRKSGVVIVVEGHLDVQGLKLLGKRNVVAVGGNALNQEMLASLIAARAKNVFMWFDADDRGAYGCSKAVAFVLEDGRVDIYVIQCKDYKDVGEIMKEHDRQQILDRQMESIIFGSAWLGEYMSETVNDFEKQQAIYDAKDLYLSIKNDVHKQEFIKKLCKGLKLKPTELVKLFTADRKEATSKKKSTEVVSRKPRTNAVDDNTRDRQPYSQKNRRWRQFVFYR